MKYTKLVESDLPRDKEPDWLMCEIVLCQLRKSDREFRIFEPWNGVNSRLTPDAHHQLMALLRDLRMESTMGHNTFEVDPGEVLRIMDLAEIKIA